MLYILKSKQNNNNQILNNPQVTIQCGGLKQSELQGFFIKKLSFTLLVSRFKYANKLSRHTFSRIKSIYFLSYSKLLMKLKINTLYF